MKKDRIYNTLKKEFQQGVFPPGSKLPKEPELAQQFHVARGTLRMALKQLEDEGYLLRMKSQGTFVKERFIPPEEKVLSLLVPFPNFLNQNLLEPVFLDYASFFYGAVRAASEEGWRVQTVTYSRTNSQEDIDWEALEVLQKDSRVIIYNHWYNRIFNTLLKRGTRCGIFLSVDTDIHFPWDSFLDRSIVCNVPYNQVYGETIRTLYQRGARKFLLTGPYLTGFNSRPAVYSAAMKELGLPADMADLEDKDHSAEKYTLLLEKLRGKKYDAVLAEMPEEKRMGVRDYYKELGLPRSTRLLLHLDQPLFKDHDPSLSAFRIDTGEAGYQLAKKLIESAWIPEKFYTKMEFIDRDSTK